MPLKDAVEIGQLVGKSASSVRACVNRLACEGILTREGIGRKKACYRLSPLGRALADDVVARFVRIHEIVEAAQQWDETWTLVSFDVPERMRKRRDEFRAGLRQMGFGQLTHGLWVAPRDASQSVKELADSLRVGNKVVISISKDIKMGRSTISSSVSNVWPLSQLNQDYSKMRTSLRSRISRMRERIRGGLPPDSREAFLEIFTVFSEAAELISRDPCLPEELLPENWLGLEVQDLIHEYFHMIHGLELNDQFSYLLKLPTGLHIPLPRKNRRRT